MRTFLLGVWLCCSSPAWAAHAYAQFGDILYPPGFKHFSHVNPVAPKGGDISLVAPTRASSFDKYNPFTMKGTAPPGLGFLMFETLLVGNTEEPTTAYGLLAEDVTVAPDKLSVTFRLHPEARFHNNDPVLAADVKYSFDRLTSKEAAPQFRTYFSEVKGATVLSEREIKFEFKRANAELPLIVGGMAVFSQKWGAGKPLDQVVTDVPIASGPYKLGKTDFGKDIQYVLYKDTTAQFEAFKAGEFDYIQAFVAREWARGYKGKLFDNGTLIKQELQHGNAGDFQGFMFNTRLAKFKDKRVRQAIGLAMDYEWMNRQLFYQAYTRVRGYFVGSDFEAKGLPAPDELVLLQSLRDKLPPEVFTESVPLPPQTNLDPASGHTLRDHLRQARDLLAQAGWTYRDGALRNDKGEAFTLEFLDNSGSMGRVVTPYAKNLEKLGFKVNYKVVDFAVLQKRMDVFDFFNPRRIHALATTVARTAGGSALAARVTALQLRHHLLDRSTRHELDDHEGEQQNPKQRWDHQQQAFQDVTEHVSGLLPSWRCCPTRCW